MRTLLIVCLASAASLPAQSDPQIAVNAGGKPFAVFHYGTDANKPYMAPIWSPSGKIVTRGFPMQNIPGESRDHLHHRGLWFSYDAVNGVKFWENDPSYTKPHIGKIVVRNAALKGDVLTATMDWNDPSGKTLLVENRKTTFHSDPKVRTIDFEITLTAATDVTFGDTKEGAFAIRLNDAFTEKRGGKMVNAEGLTGMANVWGKRSNWVDYTAVLDGERLGVAMFDHPKNPRHPTYWHARDYGLFALDPFGRNAFDPDQPESLWKLPEGQKLRFLWRVAIHPGDAQTGKVAELYREYAAQ